MSVSPLLFERYELKYLIPLDQVDEISRFVEIYCELDPFSKKEDDGFYKVNNIYLDSPNFLFLNRRLAGMDHRFNMRIRSYGDNPVFPFFCEVKHKTMGIVKKHRAKIFEEKWAEIFENKDFSKLDDNEISDLSNYKKNFLRLAFIHDVQPKVFTQYRRKAYASNVDEYARVTFDRDLKYQKRNTYDMSPDESELNHYDNPLKFYDDRNIIMELKCTTNVPKWFIDMITLFNLERVSFSKYANGVEEVFLDNSFYKSDRVSAMAVDEFI